MVTFTNQMTYHVTLVLGIFLCDNFCDICCSVKLRWDNTHGHFYKSNDLPSYIGPWHLFVLRYYVISVAFSDRDEITPMDTSTNQMTYHVMLVASFFPVISSALSNWCNTHGHFYKSNDLPCYCNGIFLYDNSLWYLLLCQTEMR